MRRQLLAAAHLAQYCCHQHPSTADDGAEDNVETGVFKAGVKSENEEVVREEAGTGWP
jgi:hypothetical protein